jgi:uncharacterized membrane protein
MSAMMLASAWLTTDPVWPRNSPAVGLLLFAASALLVAGLTVAGYLAARPRRPGRLAVLLGLRLAAVLVVAAVCLRPSLARQDDAALPSRLLVLVDASRSMSISDELNSQTRWQRARAILRNPQVEAALRRLQDRHKLEVVHYQGAEDVRRLDLDGAADGKRTDVGGWLHELFKAHGGDRELRGLLIFSDGADNGTRFPALEEAARWRGLGCPVQPFALGSTTTAPRQRDVAFVPDKVLVTPSPVRVKNRLTVKGVLDAPGFENARVTLRLFLDGKEAAPPKEEFLLKTAGNEVEMSCDAPAKAGEVKVTLKVDPLAGEVSTLNNEVSTFATVTKDGLSVLWVEGKKRAFEAVFAIRHALSRDPRFRVYYAELLRDGRKVEAGADLLDLKKRHYDVIVIGDIPADRFAEGNPGVFARVEKLVKEKQTATGLLMLGGYETFGNGGWPAVPEIVRMMPVGLDEPGQVEGPVRFRPTAAAFTDYVLGAPGNLADRLAPWEALPALDGMTRLGRVREKATVYGRDQAGRPVLVGRAYGEGRVLAFAGDTTWRAWRRTPEAIPLYNQFWRQALLWLAHQEKTGGSVVVEPDTRRLPAGNNNRLGFTVRVRGKSGKEDVKDLRVTAKVIGPNKDETEVSVFPEHGEQRGSYWKTNEPGEYLIRVSATGVDADGRTKVSGTAEARVLAYAEDVESLRPAADHDFLARLAAAGGGKLRPAGEAELVRYLDGLNARPVAHSRPRAELWPQWRRDPASHSAGDQAEALWTSGALACFVVFAALLCAEWYLRRRWGLV